MAGAYEFAVKAGYRLGSWVVLLAQCDPVMIPR